MNHRWIPTRRPRFRRSKTPGLPLLAGLMFALGLLFAPGCSLLEPGPVDGETPPAPTGSAAAATGSAQPLEETPGPEETPSSPAGDGLVTMRLWLPPQFAPDPNSEAGAMLKARLDEFTLLHPGVRITVRVKGETGSGGMVASLDAAADAVPESLPDLVLMPRLEMERAAASSLLTPYPDPLDNDWYGYALALSVVGQNVYGLPFAGDALVLAYRPETLQDPPRDWTTTLSSPVGLLFAGSSPEAYFTFALYEAAGGRLIDENGRAFLDTPVLAALLEFYADANAAGVLDEGTVVAVDETAVYQSFQAGLADMAVSWVSNRIRDPESNLAATGLPTVSSVPYTLVTTWNWVLSNPNPDRLALSTELAQFLTAPEFLSGWTLAAGVLPPRASALAGWPDSIVTSLASRIVLSAHPVPPLQVIEDAGPAVRDAIEDVLLGEASPQEAAEAAAARVNSP